ncbi:hypothetical protein SDC9_114562 [bioreactor metagenome]|uniref:Uncharacterized protein n=1 Tax=bioreactor metagenome TaxID=1076179 RepID=A0A645BRA2_9ZZZZ
MCVREFADDLRRRRDDVFVSLHREQPRQRGDDPRLLGNAQRTPCILLPFRVGESRRVHAAVHHHIFVARGDIRLDALVDHRLGDGVDFIAVTRGDPFGLFVQAVLPPFFVGVERLSVDGVDHHRNPGVPGRDPADHSGFGTVGVDYVEFPLAEEFFQGEIGFKIVERLQFAHQRGQFDRFERRKVDVVQQFSFASGRRPGDQHDFVPFLQVAEDRVEGVFLCAADDHPGDDVADFHLIGTHGSIPPVRCCSVKPSLPARVPAGSA